MLDPDLDAAIRARLQDAPFAGWFGIELVSLDEGTGTVRLKLAAHHLNPGGIAHGGVAAALLDSVIGLALRTRLGMGATHVTTALHLNYLRPVSDGTIVATGHAVSSGGRVGYGEGAITDAGGALLVRGSATFMVWEPGRGLPETPG
ncbi:MAG TPA: PaaI family thioesterase [Actinomycetota bacterium]